MLDFSCIFSVIFPLEFYPKFNSLSNALNSRAPAPLLTDLRPFSHDNFLKRDFFLDFLFSVDPLQDSDRPDKQNLLFGIYKM